eukprot:3969391-Amphidinium_carterae.1
MACFWVDVSASGCLKGRIKAQQNIRRYIRSNKYACIHFCSYEMRGQPSFATCALAGIVEWKMRESFVHCLTAGIEGAVSWGQTRLPIGVHISIQTQGKAQQSCTSATY